MIIWRNMEEISLERTEDLHVPMIDGTLLVVRRTKCGDKAVLVFPALGSTIDNDFHIDLCNIEGATTYIVELRGHGLSEGRWSLEQQREDMRHIIKLLREHFHSVYVIAHDITAALMLESECDVDGMILVNPLLHTSIKSKQLGSARGQISCELHIPRARVQAPTILYATHDVLHKVSGPVKLFTSWKYATDTERIKFTNTIKNAVHDLFLEERPIRLIRR